MKKEIEKTEKEIAAFETEITEIEKKMNDPEFYNLPNTADIFAKYNNLKESHAKKMEVWEEMQLRIEEYSNV